MECLLIELIGRKQLLEEVISVTEEVLRDAPDGKLRIDYRKGNARYFQVMTKYSFGSYIPKDGKSLVEKLAEKGFAEKLLSHANKELAFINRYISFLKEHSVEHVYRKLNDKRKKLVTPILMDGKTYASMWLAKPFPGNPQFPEGLTYKTKRGDMVRSKSEVLIANIYYELGIPYKYECPIVLENGITRYPDFTLLDIAHHRTVYHEHLGIIEDPEYRKSTLLKLREYRENGIYAGKNLILTSETSYVPFDSEQFRMRIRDSFKVDMLRRIYR